MSHSHDKVSMTRDAEEEICIIDPEQERDIIWRRRTLRAVQKGGAKALNLSSSTVVGRKRNRGCSSESDRSSQRAKSRKMSENGQVAAKKIRKRKGVNYMDSLPDCLVLEIFGHLPKFPTLMRMREVCQRWSKLSCNGRLWTRLSFEGHEHVSSKNLNGICKFVKLHKLKTLSLAKVHGVDETCLRMIPRKECAGTLESVDLSWCSAASDRSVVEFSRCPGLKELRLSHCRSVSRRSVRILAVRCPRLEVLDMNCISGLRDSLLSFIGQHCPLLRILNIANGKNITDTGIKHIASGCPNLEILDISWCEQVTDDSIFKIANEVCNLKHISLSETSVTDKGIRELTKHCHLLENIQLARCGHITDVAIHWIITRVGHQLKLLNLASCEQVSDDCIRKVVACCNKLVTLDVSKRPCRPLSELFQRLSHQRDRNVEVFF